MKFIFGTLYVLVAAVAFAQPKPAASLPPLIDRELFFGNPEIASATLSPDGRFIAFRKPWEGTMNIWVKKTEEPFDQARRITAETRRPVPAFFWSRDSKYVLFVQDQGGDENYNVHAVDPSAAQGPAQGVPAARNLTDAKGARAIIYDLPRTNPDLIHVGLNDRDAAWHDLYQVRISTGERTLLRKNTDRVAGWVFDRAAKLRLALRTTDSGDTEVLRVADAGFEKVYECTVFETCGPVQFHPDNTRVYMITNSGAPDLVRLILFDPATKKEEVADADPENRVDFGEALFSEKTGQLVGTVYLDDTRRVYFRDKEFQSDYETVKKKLAGKEILFGGSTADERKWMIVASDDTEPGERHIYDRDAKTLTKQYHVFDKLPREHLAEMKPIRYKSSDGLEVPAYLTLPKGVPAKSLPAIVVPHGGPWARDAFGYSAMAQFFANRGYAVLQPNFRGSTGYGEKFLNAANNQWGEKMQDDITWGVKHLVSEGIADPKRVGILGGSYGGYAALAGVAFTPDVYAAGVSIVGPSNLKTLLESIPPYWEAGRKMFHMRMGDPTTPEGTKQMERQSPLFSANKIKTPLLVIQGANDPRVKKAESDQIVVALRDRSFPVEYIVAPDEGHGFARPVNNMAMYAAIEKFLSKHLEGRFQDSMTPEVTKRLGEITVDPKTVTLARPVDSSSVKPPTATQPLVAGSSTYNTVIAMGGQSMKMETTTTVAEQGNTWLVTESAKTPQGDVVDSGVLDKDSLTVRSREIRQGPMHIKLSFEGGKASGSMAMGGQEKPVAAELGGTLFADGAGAYPSIAVLPLKEGYSTTFRNFDVMKQKSGVKQAKVTAVEEVTVPAGTFKAWKVEIASAEGDPGQQTVWIDTVSRRVVKTSATLPQMGGAVASAELVK
ncbi:MAG: S9 family peptidase [Acidobacteriota bacterium]|nr:S9 family peptidase [Acidobacteriota bacterium]